MPKKLRISFSETDPRRLKLLKERASVNLGILRAKSKKQEEELQKQLAKLNKDLRGF